MHFNPSFEGLGFSFLTSRATHMMSSVADFLFAVFTISFDNARLANILFAKVTKLYLQVFAFANEALVGESDQKSVNYIRGTGSNFEAPYDGKKLQNQANCCPKKRFPPS